MRLQLERLGDLACLLIVSLFFLTACGGGGGGMASTILAFEDAGGAPIPGGANFFAQVTGGPLTAALNVNPDASGRVSVNLEPGTYEVGASYRRQAEAILILATQTITVGADDAGRVQRITLVDNELSAGWQLFRNHDYPGAIAAFEAYGARAGAANVGSNAAWNALGWAHGRVPSFHAAVDQFNRALEANPANTDAQVGLAGIFLVRNSSTSDPQNAAAILTQAIDAPGNYTSAPTHDNLTEADLYVCRALAQFLQGDVVGMRANLDAAKPSIAGASDAGVDLFNTLELIVSN